MNLYQMYKNRKKVLGMNERNLKYIRPNNLSTALEIADDKLLTKRILEKNELPTPKLIDVIKDYDDLRNFNWEKLPKSFVMKPVHGLEGSGIEIFYNRDKEGNWIKGDGTKVSESELKMMAIDIIDGKYSLHNQKDSVFFEERVKMHKAFKYYAYKGAPDIRVIVFNNIPVMSYVRLPTKESKGKGNLAKGAIGAAIDLVTGTTTTGIIGKSEPIETVPGTKLSVSGLNIPYWNKILRTSIEVQKATGLGFAAIDFLIDRDRGPLIIELNARPGLSIQIANKDGLKWRLQKASGIKVTTVSKGVRVAKDLFGGQTEQEIEKISGKQVVSHIEPVDIITQENSKVSTLALIDTSRRTTTIDEKLAKKAGIIPQDAVIEDTSISDITFNLAGNIITSDCRIVPKPIKGYKLLIGRKDLGNYLVDIRRVARGISGRQKESLITALPYTKPEQIDKQLAEISKHIFIVRNIRPINAEEQQKLFNENPEYNPQFQYDPVRLDTDKLIDSLSALRPDTSSLIGKLFADKISELKKEVYLLEAIGDDDKFAQISQELYGEPDAAIFKKALEVVEKSNSLRERRKKKKKEPVLTEKEVKKMIEDKLQAIGFDGRVKYVQEGPQKASVTKSGNVLKINTDFKFTKSKLIGTLAHEVDVHLKRAMKGAQKDFLIFSYGTAGYIEIEEGLAVWNKASELDSIQPVRNAALMYISAYMNQYNSFTETYNFFRKIGITKTNAFNFTLRTKKGISNTNNPGAFLKDSLYFKGYLKVSEMSDEERGKLLENGKTHEVIEIAKVND